MAIQLIAIDMDGTLLDDHQQLSKTNITAIKKATAAGIQIVLASGRPLAGLRPYLTQLDLWQKGHYTVTFNGAMVQENATDTAILEHTVDLATFQTFYDLSQTLNLHIHAEDKTKIYTPNQDISYYTAAESALVHLDLRYQPLSDFAPDKRFAKVMIIDTPELITAALPNVPAELKTKYTIVQSMPFFLEVMAKHVNKGQAIMELGQALHLQQNEIMAIGDERNDLSMIQAAGLGVAMGNAVDTVKAAADAITGTNTQNGVAQAIDQFTDI